MSRNQYFTFIPEEGITYLQEYIMERIRDGEDITYDSPLLQLDTRGVKKNKFLRTPLVTRDIREAIVLAGLNLRPYVLRAYFATALDIAESKGLISHPWRQFIMGHKGDIEAGSWLPSLFQDDRNSGMEAAPGPIRRSGFHII